MAATGTPTPNIGLRIPLGTDPASVDDINYNSNLLDTKLGAVGSDSVQDQIDTLNGNLSDKIANVIKSGGISNATTITLVSSLEGAHALILSRYSGGRAVIVLTDYWADSYTVIAGTIPSGITITKSANSHDITITNNTGSAISYSYL